MNKRLYRDEYHKVLGGVCSGLAEYFEMDVTIVRLLFAFTFAIMGAGFLTYIILWIVLPKKGYPYTNFKNPTVDYTVPPPQPPDGQQYTAGGNPFGGSPYGSNPFQDNPFKGNPVVMPPKQKSNAGVIMGFVLIIIGAIILVTNFDLIPDFDFEKIWPCILVVVGAAIIVSGQKKHDWSKQDWKTAEKKDAPITDNTATDETTAV